MSSPIHHAKDLDAKLMYAPPWARHPKRAMPITPATLLADAPDRRIAPAREVFSGDRAMQELQRRLALHPHRVPEPPMQGARALSPMALRLGAVTAVAALVAWGLVSLTGIKKSAHDAVQTDVASPQAVAADAAPADVAPPPADVSSAPRAGNPVKVVRVLAASEVPPVAPSEFSKDNNAPPPAGLEPVPAAQPPSTQSVGEAAALSADEIAMLVKRGKDYLANGDFASARLLFHRAAAAGSADAALALGASFDPLVIARLGAIGATADVARAREWYRKAADLGSQSASKQLANLAQQ